ncbi:HAMP domain-containing histidine kinase [Kovacikia minuta CCNUW1]|uniref:sensor histidine kinase n=1 Tax=Kovacikia minuta TaxID=2931930 RepID=UPI001CCCA4A3|nr:HAMP domain-containing sensor histidine kinase [Kovacikia minuta]UBF27434.1 HAMP domain-containing histidine kinase [Kovacikia minuta CCNUW1]
MQAGVNIVPKWLLPTLSEILALNDPTWTVQYQPFTQNGEGENSGLRRPPSRIALQRVRAEREWAGAIAALEMMLQQATTVDSPICCDGQPATQGIVLSGPLPVLSQPDLMTKISTWSLTANPLHITNWFPFKLLPAVGHPATIAENSPTASSLPLLPDDPLASEQFCLVLTPQFSLVMVLGETLLEQPAFMFSFMPDVVQQAWEAIRPRILLMSSPQVERLDELIHHFAPVAPDYKTVMQFSRLMLAHLPEPLEELEGERREKSKRQSHEINPKQSPEEQNADLNSEDSATVKKFRAKRAGGDREPSPPEDRAPDVELLKALAHEIRTPLTTIRTLTRSLLKRTDLSPDVLKRLNMIDRECSEQIDRFGLIFRAVELETSATRHAGMSLIRTSLEQVFQASIPRWQKQASQRQLTLDVVLPQKMPMVVSDPIMLDQALTSLIERFTRNLPSGSHITVEVTPAGSQLKLQLQSHLQNTQSQSASQGAYSHHAGYEPLLKSLGQLLMFQPETGTLTLNLAVTKNLFQALGGKLIVKQRPQQGEVMTVFLPLEGNSSGGVDA